MSYKVRTNADQQNLVADAQRACPLRLLTRIRATFRRWTKPINDPEAKQRRDDRVLGLIVCNIIFCLIVLICFECEVQGRARGHTETYFYIGEAIVGFAYVVNSHLSRTFAAKLLRIFDSSRAVPDTTSGFSIPTEAIGIFNAFTVGFLTYYTGGPSNSPYAQVLVAMLLIAEQTRRLRNPNEGGGLTTTLTIPFKEFRTFLSITALFYLLLGYLQWKYPIHISTAPAGVTIGITLVIFLVGTIANYLSGSSRTDAPSSKLEAAPEPMESGE